MPNRLTLPIAVTSDGSLASLPQDHPLEVARSVGLLLATRPGERRSVPEYGLPDPIFGGFDAAEAAEVISDWEPRADPALVDQYAADVIDVIDGARVDRATIRPAAPTNDDEGA